MTTIITAFRAWLACAVFVAAAAGPLTVEGGSRPGVRPAQTASEETAVERQREPFADVPFRRPIIRAGQDYLLPAGDTVREVRSVFGDAVLEGRVEQDVLVIMGSARLTGTAVVEGSLVVIGGSAEIDERAQVGHDVVVIAGTLQAGRGFSPGGNHVVIGTPALGNAVRDVTPWLTRGLLWGRLIVPDLRWIWVITGIFFGLYLALNIVLDRPVAASADVVVARPLSAFIVGLLVLLLSVPVLAIVAASVIGIAVIPFLFCALVAAGLIGKAAVARAIGRITLRLETPEGRLQGAAAFTAGFALLLLAYMVPVLGFVTWALASSVGLGAAAVTFRQHLRRERPARAVAPSKPAARDSSETPSAPPLTSDLPETPAVAELPMDLPASSGGRTGAGDGLAPPRPAYTEGLAQYPRATFLDRAAAFALDCILVAIINVVLDTDRHDGVYVLLLLAYHIGFWAWRGTTLGGIICNLRVVRTDGADLRFVDALVRGLTSVFSIAALGIGCFWMLQDPERQTWHDKIAGTLVVKVPRDLVLP